MPLRLKRIHDLAWVHEPVWIQCALDTPHHVDGVQAELFLQGSLLSQTNAVLAGTGAVHLQRTVYHVVHTLLDGCSLLRVLAVVHNTFVEVAVADVAKDARKESEVIHLLL
jgi:hypothetical protein